MNQIKGFALYGCEGKEELAVFDYCCRYNIPRKICRCREDAPEGYIPVGTVKWCDQFLPKERVVPDYYPEFLAPYLYRRVWRTDTWPLGKKVFIKPADIHKRFDGFITSGTYKGKKKPPFWCSEIVSFQDEWRYYVADGKILTGEWYWGDQEKTPDAPVLNVPIPAGFCGSLDFGTLNTGEFALVEVHPPYACGWYGKDHKLYVEWLIKGWEYMMRSVL